MENRECIVLCGGLGTRLRQVVSDRPKSMALIGNRPFLAYVLDQLSKHKFTHVVLATGYMHECIYDFFGEQYSDMRLSYSREISPLGTGGALCKALSLVIGDSFFAINGDTLIKLDEKTLCELEMHKMSLMTVNVENASRYGMLQISNGLVTNFIEKNSYPSRGLINAGLYHFTKSYLTTYGQLEFKSLESDFLIPMSQKKCLNAVNSDSYFIDIGIPEAYSEACTKLINE